MLFASTALAARIERAECSLIAEGAAAIRRRSPAAQPVIEPIAGGVAVVTERGSPFNKVAGLGFQGPVDERALASIERRCAERGIPVQAEVSSLADPAAGELLTRRGYRLVGVENVLGLDLTAFEPTEADDSIAVSECQTHETQQWIDVVATGFAAPDAEGVPSHESFEREALENVLGDLVTTGFIQLFARRDGVPAGGATLRVCDGVAQLCGAATLPAHRRRGVQAALLAARLVRGYDAGCDTAVVTTQPGSTSHENAQRRGFQLLYTRTVLVLKC